MSHIMKFYRGDSPDSEGRFLREIWEWNEKDLEIFHDYVQWRFPLPEPSRHNHDAPLLTEKEIAEFRGDECLRANLKTSFERFLTFLGLAPADDESVIEGPPFWNAFLKNGLTPTPRDASC